MNKIEQSILRHVEETGWSLMSVSPPADTEDSAERWTYTIGLPKTFRWPELIVFGLAADLARDLLNDAVKACKDRALVPSDGLMLDRIIVDQQVKLVDGSRIPESYLGSASWFAQHVGTEFPPQRLQFVWPDDSGNFPEDEACDPNVCAAQTPLETAP